MPAALNSLSQSTCHLLLLHPDSLADQITFGHPLWLIPGHNLGHLRSALKPLPPLQSEPSLHPSVDVAVHPRASCPGGAARRI